MKNLIYIFLFQFVFLSCYSQDSALHIDKIPPGGILLDKGWKFKQGDSPEYAKPKYDDRAWQSINPSLDVHDSLPQIPRSGIFWFRLHLLVDSNINQELALMIFQSGASELYLNGHLIGHFGILSTNPREIRAYDPRGKPVLFPVNKGTGQVLAVRYALQPKISYTIFSYDGNSALKIRINRVETSMEMYYHAFSGLSASDIFLAGVFFILAILHLAFYLFYSPQKANLYFFMFALFMGATQMARVLSLTNDVVYDNFYYFNLIEDLELLSRLFMLTALYFLLANGKAWVFWMLTTIIFISILLNAWTYMWGGVISIFILPNLISLEIGRIAIKSVKMKKRGGWILVGGAIGFLVFTVAEFFAIVLDTDYKASISIFSIMNLTVNLATLSIPVATSIYLGLDFAITNRSLKQKLNEIENLSQKTIEQEKEKQQILASQNTTLEKQVSERTAALSQSLMDLKETQSQLVQREKMASLGELTAGIAHEIQNPLNFVNNFSEVNTELIDELEQEADKGNMGEVKSIAKDIKENEQKINHHGKRADAIVKGMLQHSRSSSGQKELVSINAIADECLKLSYHSIRAKEKFFQANLKTDFDESIGKIPLIQQDIVRVLVNLFNNAFYAVNEKSKQQIEAYEPTVSVSTKKINDKVILTVMDNGNGVPQKVIGKIFQPFFTTKPAGQGTGLGLSLSYDIVKANGGDISVYSKEEEFTEFVVRLPVSG